LLIVRIRQIEWKGIYFIIKITFLNQSREVLFKAFIQILIFFAYFEYFWTKKLKLRCDSRFQRALLHAVAFAKKLPKEITLIWANQRNNFENATACSKRTLKTTVATQLKKMKSHCWIWELWWARHLIDKAEINSSCFSCCYCC